MDFTLKNGYRVNVELNTDSYGFPSLVVNGNYVVGLTGDGQIMLSNLSKVETSHWLKTIPITDQDEYGGLLDSVADTITEVEYRNRR